VGATGEREHYIVRLDAVYSCGRLLTFRRNLLLPFLGLTSTRLHNVTSRFVLGVAGTVASTDAVISVHELEGVWKEAVIA
jgi:hypothetical protein